MESTNKPEFQQYSDDALRTAGEGDLLEVSKVIKEMFGVLHDIPGTCPPLWAEFMSDLEKARQRDEQKVGIMYDCLGLTGEAGEIADYVKKCIGHGKQFDPENVKKELGDNLWYVNRLTRRIGATLKEIADKNIAKLKARYPAGFSHEASEKRKE